MKTVAFKYTKKTTSIITVSTAAAAAAASASATATATATNNNVFLMQRPIKILLF